MSILDYLILFLMATILVAHTGIAYAGVLQSPGNLLDWIPGRVQKIKNSYLRDLLTCMKCVSGQVALWSFVIVSIEAGIWHPVYSILAGILWICWVIVVTDQLGKWEGYG